MVNKKSNQNDDTWGVVSISLGIMSILFFLLPHLAIIAAIIAIVAYKKQKKIKEMPIATAGLITAIIGLVLNTITLLLFIALFYSIGNILVNLDDSSIDNIPNLEIMIDEHDTNDSIDINTRIIISNSSHNLSNYNNTNITR